MCVCVCVCMCVCECVFVSVYEFEINCSIKLGLEGRILFNIFFVIIFFYTKSILNTETKSQVIN